MFTAWAREHYEHHFGKSTAPTTNTVTTPTTPVKEKQQSHIPVTPHTLNIQSPIILGHHNNSINNNINWSPTILGHYHHSQRHGHNNTLPPIHYMDMIEYMDHLSSDHDNLKNFSDFVHWNSSFSSSY